MERSLAARSLDGLLSSSARLCRAEPTTGGVFPKYQTRCFPLCPIAKCWNGDMPSPVGIVLLSEQVPSTRIADPFRLPIDARMLCSLSGMTDGYFVKVSVAVRSIRTPVLRHSRRVAKAGFARTACAPFVEVSERIEKTIYRAAHSAPKHDCWPKGVVRIANIRRQSLPETAPELLPRSCVVTLRWMDIPPT